MADTWREITADWKGERAFIGRNSSGGTVQIGILNDQPGASPMELLLMGVAGCTGVDIANIMTKARQRMKDLQVRVRGKFAPEGTLPRIFTEIEIIYLVWGEGIEPAVLENAIELSEAKYCSASAMLRGAADIHWRYVILAPGESFSG